VVVVESIVLSLWTANPILAATADAAGVDRIGIDLDEHGKEARQAGQQTRISRHRVEQLAELPLRRARRFVRINPLHSATASEIERVLDHGAEVVMLPMVRSAAHASEFLRLLRGRAHPVLLVEHVEGLDAIEEILRVDGVVEIHVGLNDLALSMGLRNRWMTLCGDRLREAGRRVRAAGVRFGLGGIARFDDTRLPVNPDLLYAQLVRCAANATLLARSFVSEAAELPAAIDAARARILHWQSAGDPALAAAHQEYEALAAMALTW
jgi:2-keto-3-deoxy-L-rhamnonate aldolase RhmA